MWSSGPYVVGRTTHIDVYHMLVMDPGLLCGLVGHML